MDSRLQGKLFRAAQEREIDRVGGGSRSRSNTNHPTSTATYGAVRETIPRRLGSTGSVVNLKLPALRERAKDILALPAFCPQICRGERCRSALAPEPERLRSAMPARHVRELGTRSIVRAVSPEMKSARRGALRGASWRDADASGP